MSRLLRRSEETYSDDNVPRQRFSGSRGQDYLVTNDIYQEFDRRRQFQEYQLKRGQYQQPRQQYQQPRQQYQQSNRQYHQEDYYDVPIDYYPNPQYSKMSDPNEYSIPLDNLNGQNVPNYENWQPQRENEVPPEVFLIDDVLENPNRIHSMHRNAQEKANSNQVSQVYEARTGGRRHIRGDVQNYNIEFHANEIVNKMKQDEELMENSPNSEELRKETLRNMPQSLTVKRCVKRKLTSVSENSRRRPIGCFTALKYRIKFAFSKFKNNLKDLSYVLELWYKPLKEIEGNFGSGVASFFKFLRWMFTLNLFLLVPIISFVVVPQWVYGGVMVNQESFGPWDVFTGEGYLENTALSYGFYSNDSVSVSNMYYNISYAYFFTNISVYLVALIILCVSAAQSYRKSFIETEGAQHNIFAQKIFCGWDFSIATEKAALLKSAAIYNELRELLADSQKAERELSPLQRFYNFMLQFVANILVLVCFAGIGYLIWYCLEDETVGVVPIACIINVIMFVGPLLLNYLVKYEDYKEPRWAFYLTLMRTFLLGFVIIGVFVGFWLHTKSSGSSTDKSWEVALGQEMYRLILFDFVFSVILAFIFDLILFWCKNPPEFDISRNTMQIIYNQSLFWMGLFYSPLLSLMMVLKLFLIFYIREFTVKKLCKPSAKSWRAARNQTWFTIMVFFGLMLVCLLQGYIITSIPPSQHLGPFKNYAYMYELVTSGMLNLEKDSQAWKYLLYIAKPGCVALILLTLSVFVYILKEKANAQREFVTRYWERLIWEAKDKEYLLKEIERVTRGGWKYRPNEGRKFDPINMMPRKNGFKRQESEDYRHEPSTSQLLSENQNDVNFIMDVHNMGY